MLVTRVDMLLKILLKVFYLSFVFEEIFCHIEYDDIVLKYYAQRQDWKTSNLGTFLFKNIGLDSEPRFSQKNRTFLILQWLHWGYGESPSIYWLKKYIKLKHGQSTSAVQSTTRQPIHCIPDPLDGCSVRNCLFTDNISDLDMADAVVVNVLHTGVYLPPSKGRNPKQLWVWMSEEAPVLTKIKNLASLANIYNWSMTYRTDADIPMPYGRTVPRPMKIIDDVRNEEYMVELVPNWESKRRDVLVAALISNCVPKYRMNYVTALQKYIKVDIYGGCSDNKNLVCLCFNATMDFYYKQDCPHLNNYLFYLDFENSRCRQYLTEKVFHNAFSKGAIPVIMGPPKQDCNTLLPPNSFLHVDSYESPKELASHIKSIAIYNDTILWYHRWRNHFKVVNEHGYLNTSMLALCRICEALNYNDDKPQTYTHDDLRLFLDQRILCSPPYES